MAAPLGGVLEAAAVVRAGYRLPLRVEDFGAFLDAFRKDIRGIVGDVRCLGSFPEAHMRLLDELGWTRPHEVTYASLLLWAGGVEEVAVVPRDRHHVRRTVERATDLQLARLVQALVFAADPDDVHRGAEAVRYVVERCLGLLLRTGRDEFATTMRLWSVACLPAYLSPDSGASAASREKVRAYAARLYD
ncbi:hypothetical protein [Streptomyces zhihengii]|uniref:hypothetical protein n=1 Tax=Streptomyces zhihengii TaxID=1818004 RepID=UPI0033A28BF2